MRKIFLLLAIVSASVYSYAQSGIKIIAPIIPNSTTDTGYGTHDDTLGVGGYMCVTSIASRNAIPMARRKQDMLVAVGTPITDTVYQLKGGLTNANWTVFASGGVQTVNGQSPVGGAITLTTTNVAEGSNQYYTNTRVQGVIGGDTASNALLTPYVAGNTYTNQSIYYASIQKSGTDNTNFYNINTQKAVVTDTNNISEGLLVWWSNDTGEYIVRFDSTKWEITPYGQAVAYWTYDGGVTWQPRVYLYSSSTTDVRNYGGGIWHGNLYWFFRTYDPVGLVTKRFVGVSTDRGHTFTYTEITGLSGWDNASMTPFSHMVIGRGDTALQGFYTTGRLNVLQIINPTTFQVLTSDRIATGVALTEPSWDYMPSTQTYLLLGRNDGGQLPVEQFQGVYSGSNITWTDAGATNTSITGVKGVSPWVYADSTRSNWIGVIPQRNVVNTSGSAGAEKDSLLVFVNSAASVNGTPTGWVEKASIQRPLPNNINALNGYPTGGKCNDSTIKLIFSDRTQPLQSVTITGQQNSSWNTPYEFSINYRTSKIANNSKTAQGSQFLNPFTQNYDVRSSVVSGTSYDPIRKETHSAGRSKQYINYTTDYSDNPGDTYCKDSDQSIRRIPHGAIGQFWKEVAYGSVYTTPAWSNIDQLQGRAIDITTPNTFSVYMWNFGSSGDWYPVTLTQWAYSHTEQNTVDTNTVGISTPNLYTTGAAGVLKIQAQISANTSTTVDVIPNGAGTQAQVTVGNSSDINNMGEDKLNVNGATVTETMDATGAGTAPTAKLIKIGATQVAKIATANFTINEPIISSPAAYPGSGGFLILGHNTSNSNDQTLTTAQALALTNVTNTDATTIIAAGNTIETLVTITANRAINLPTPSTNTGDELVLIDQNTGSFVYNFNTNKPIDENGATINNIPNNSVEVFKDNGTAWVLSNTPLQSGTSTQSGTGSATTFTIAHNLGLIPTYFNVIAGNSATTGISYITADATNITVHYTSAPASGTNNLTFYWEAKY